MIQLELELSCDDSGNEYESNFEKVINHMREELSLVMMVASVWNPGEINHKNIIVIYASSSRINVTLAKTLEDLKKYVDDTREILGLRRRWDNFVYEEYKGI